MMDLTPLFEYIDESIEDRIEQIFTSLPGHVIEFDPDTGLVKVQPGIQRVWGEKEEIIKPAPIVEVPLQIYGGSDYYVECEINYGDEGLIVFSQRCIDAWVQSGGIATKVSNRMFDETDAFFIPGVHSIQNRAKGHSNNGIRLRNKSGDKFIHLKNDGSAQIDVTRLTVNAQTTINGDTTINGNTSISKSLTVAQTVKAATINALSSLLVKGLEMLGHKHGGVEPGKGTTGGPQ
ncbi:baseplate spike [Vibrio phage vB_VpM-pA2SJ1]|uniref:Baseplate spike n=1 Tax=Vibrio phage vB_VpM-pA2SJ1 TaxID=3095964 RepID=A0AAX4J5X1_9CAUD